MSNLLIKIKAIKSSMLEIKFGSDDGMRFDFEIWACATKPVPEEGDLSEVFINLLMVDVMPPGSVEPKTRQNVF